MKGVVCLSIALGVLLAGCDAFEFSPHQVKSRRSPTDLNQKNLERLLRQPNDDTVTIGLVGDSQRYYDNIDAFVERANSLDGIDFFLLAGDVSEFGLRQEYEWVNERLSMIKQPYLTVIGNHDVPANGEAAFRRMFGPLNFSFVYDSVKIVAHNTNSLEYERDDVPDLDWLAGELRDDPAVRHIVPVAHVPPFSPDQFAAEKVVSYTQLLARTPKVLVSLSGHVHEHLDHYPYNDGVRYLTSYAFADDAFVVLKIVDGKVFKSIVTY